MKRLLQLLGVLLTTSFATSASAAIDPNAAEVLLRTSCTENGVTIDNCFSSMTTLNTWIWNTRHPGQTSGRTPLLVSIGPGKFGGQFLCSKVADDDPVAPGAQYRGHVTLRGSGVNNSILEHSTVIETEQCDNLTFEALTIRNTSQLRGVINIGGTTVWNNVELFSHGYAWSDGIVDHACSERGVPPGKHIWNNTRIFASAGTGGGLNSSAIAYYNHCDDALFLGSEINAIASGPAGMEVVRNVAIYTYGGVIRVYGGAIRVLSDPGVRADLWLGAEIAVLTALPSAEVHVHGTGIDMISGAPNNLHAISIGGGGMVHANGAAYMMKTGAGGERWRIFVDPLPDSDPAYPWHVMAPYLWEPMTTPPNIFSRTGQDTLVVTGTADGKPHTVVYAENCSSRWFDNNTNNCF
jgi:hypothetical protein